MATRESSESASFCYWTALRPHLFHGISAGRRSLISRLKCIELYHAKLLPHGIELLEETIRTVLTVSGAYMALYLSSCCPIFTDWNSGDSEELRTTNPLIALTTDDIVRSNKGARIQLSRI